MIDLSRRGLMRGATASAMLLPFPASAGATDYARQTLPLPIGREERLARLARARALMQKNGIGAVLVESGPSLDYFTGVQWRRSERLPGVS